MNNPNTQSMETALQQAEPVDPTIYGSNPDLSASFNVRKKPRFPRVGLGAAKMLILMGGVATVGGAAEGSFAMNELGSIRSEYLDSIGDSKLSELEAEELLVNLPDMLESLPVSYEDSPILHRFQKDIESHYKRFNETGEDLQKAASVSLYGMGMLIAGIAGAWYSRNRWNKQGSTYQDYNPTSTESRVFETSKDQYRLDSDDSPMMRLRSPNDGFAGLGEKYATSYLKLFAGFAGVATIVGLPGFSTALDKTASLADELIEVAIPDSVLEGAEQLLGRAYIDGQQEEFINDFSTEIANQFPETIDEIGLSKEQASTIIADIATLYLNQSGTNENGVSELPSAGVFNGTLDVVRSFPLAIDARAPLDSKNLFLPFIAAAAWSSASRRKQDRHVSKDFLHKYTLQAGVSIVSNSSGLPAMKP